MSELQSTLAFADEQQEIGPVSSHGYRLVYVGKTHHLADVRGYAYEHRLVAERKLGRRLAVGEIVHHLNEDPLDNREENLEVLPSIAHHKAAHRSEDSDLRKPGEPNPTIQCGCGCGGTLLRFDNAGRPRICINGHFAKDMTAKCNDQTIVECACGCGQSFRKYDNDGRERRFVVGHGDRNKWKSEPRLNDDGTSVNGCTVIYAPKGQAFEYSALATSPFRGCGHRCLYCFVPKAIKIARTEFDAGAVERPNYMRLLEKDARKYQYLGVTDQVMLSFTTDPYHPGDTSLTSDTIRVLQDHGLGVCTLTKGGSRALRDIDLFRPDRDAFASTLTTLDDTFSRQWEPNAALPADRIATLKAFHDRGIFTWVSLEPTLDTESSEAIIEATHGFVDLYKIGRANYLPMTATTDWESYTHRMVALCQRLGVRHYIKRDLQNYLPEGYDNPLRTPQHN